MGEELLLEEGIWSHPQAHMGSVNNEAGAAVVARSSALGESTMERIEGNVGGEPEGAACRQEAGSLQ